MDVVGEIERAEVNRLTGERPVPDFKPGDTVRVNVKVIEGTRERVQAFRPRPWVAFSLIRARLPVRPRR